MQTALWYDNYQGAVYPLDLQANPALGRHIKKSVKSLVQICSNYIVKDSNLTAVTVQIVPKDLLVCLMKEALQDNRDRSIEVLIAHWPMESLVLGDLTPNLFTSLQPLHDTYYLSDIVRQGLRYTTSLAHTYLECLKKKMPTKLRFLDMSGYPTAEVMLFYLATHCMLAHNESRQTAMVDMYNRVIQLLPTARSSLQADISFPESSLVVKLDAFVTSDQTHAELCKALKVSGFAESRLRMHIEKLDATCLGEPKVTIMLKQINKMFLKGLRLKYNSIACDEFIKIVPELKQFHNLTALDLSCNMIHIYNNQVACDQMAETFAALPHLVRLDLSNNRIKSKLRRILQSIQQPLQYLRLSACGLMNMDLTYLAHSHHASGIRELDLSENTFTTCERSLAQLFINACECLCVLELEDTKLSDEILLSILQHISKLNHILYINIAENSFSSCVMQSFIQTFSLLPLASTVRVPYCKECYHGDTISEDQRSMLKMQYNVDLYKVSDQARGQSTGRLKIICVDISKADLN